MKILMEGDVPVGEYRGKFTKVEEIPEEMQKFGTGFIFTWKVVSGDYEGQEVTRWTGSQASSNSALGCVLAGLNGEEIETGTQVDTEEHVGQEYVLSVELTDAGRARVHKKGIRPVTGSAPKKGKKKAGGTQPADDIPF